LPEKVTGFAPVPTVPGENPEADGYNILVWALVSDWRRMRAEATAQDRYQLQQTLMMTLCFLVTILHALPDGVACYFMEHFESKVQEPGSPLVPRSARDGRDAV